LVISYWLSVIGLYIDYITKSTICQEKTAETAEPTEKKDFYLTGNSCLPSGRKEIACLPSGRKEIVFLNFVDFVMKFFLTF